MTKKIFYSSIAAAALIALVATPLSASAATPEEAAAIARSYGVSEETIQQCWNEYYANPELYPPEEIDNLLSQFIERMESVSTTVPYNPDAKPPVVTTAANSNPDKNNSKPSTQVTLKTPDGNTFTRVSPEDFIAMSYEDKQTYLSTFTPEQQAVIMENLTPEEYKSLLKQMPTDNKLNVIDGMTDIANGFGLNVNVDEITDENVILSIKNKDGELVAVSSAKETVENTGYDRRGIFAGAAALIFAGTAGMFLLVKKCFKKSENGV